jgi:hypothetical protein
MIEIDKRPRCETCRHWYMNNPQNADMGECRGNYPVAVLDIEPGPTVIGPNGPHQSMKKMIRGMFPPAGKSSFCSRHEPEAAQ